MAKCQCSHPGCYMVAMPMDHPLVQLMMHMNLADFMDTNFHQPSTKSKQHEEKENHTENKQSPTSVKKQADADSKKSVKKKVKTTDPVRDQNNAMSVDELMEKYNFNSSKIKKTASKKMKVTKTAPQPRSKPRILRGRVPFSRVANSAKTEEDEVSRKSNKYNKRFTKTKKPAKL